MCRDRSSPTEARAVRIINKRIQLITTTCPSVQEEVEGRGRNEMNPKFHGRDIIHNI